MFKQAKVVYIISEENEGNADAIIDELIEYNILYYFYEEESESFYNFISSLPKNTVFCINLNYNQNKISSSKIANIALPFISSHINFPVKVGETVWFYPYNQSEQNIPVLNSYVVDGYYLGRVHSLLNTEDTSYCFSEREQTTYNIDEKSVSDVIKEKRNDKGILEVLSTNDLYLNENSEKNVLQKCDEKVNAVVSKEILNSDYYVKTLKNYSFKPSIEVSSNTEDFIARGTYGNSIQLTSEIENNKEVEEKNKNITFESKKGKINLIVGEKERLKNISLVDSTRVKTKDNEDYLDDDGVIFNKYNNGFLPEFHNGVFIETIKTPKLFNNNFRIDQDCLESFDFKPKDSILNNISTLTISEKNIDYDIIKDKIKFSIPHVDTLFDPKTNNSSNLYDTNKNFSTVIPRTTISLSDIKNKYENQSSIVGVSDNIMFAIPEYGLGDIIFSTPNGQDGLTNYLKITNDGNFHVDSHKIVLGNLKRLPAKDGTYENGINAGLFLGFSNEMQSLVLGEQLKEFLEEIIIIQKQSISLIKDLFIASKKVDLSSKEAHKQVSSTLSVLKDALDAASKISIPLSPLGAAAQTLNVSIKSDLDTKIKEIKIGEYESKINSFLASGNTNVENKTSEELFARLETVENNLDKILSKFVKSS